MNRDPHDAFTGLATGYDLHRPGYPLEAIEAVFDGLPRPIRAADIGCGTGISTRLLARFCDHVIGIDPNPDMLAQAERSTGLQRGIEFRRGAGEETGLSAASIDVVVCAQSYHWLREQTALAEFHRVLRPGEPAARLAVLFNERDTSRPAAAEYERIIGLALDDAASRGLRVPRQRWFDLSTGGRFTRPRRLTFTNPQQFDRTALQGRARSASYWPREGTLRDELEQALDRLLDRFGSGGLVTIEHITLVTIADCSPS